MTLEFLKATVARTRAIPAGDDEPRLGTAFLVSRRLLLTCAHCLGSQGRAASEVELRFSRWAPAAKLPTAKVVHANWDLDVALLDFGEEAPVDPLPLTGRGTNGDSWESFGHPLQVGTDGIKFSGKVADARALSYGKDAMHLHCQEAADRVHGASGSPVMIDGQIAGIFTKQLLEYAPGGEPGELKPAFQAVYALPIDALASDPELASRLQWGPMGRAELIVKTARERARAATMKRIVSDAKFREDRYVERESVRESFEAFMAQEEHKCYLVVGKAGAGKTTTMAHLALNSTRGPALFFRGGIDGYSVDDIRQLVTSALVDPDGDAGAGPRHWDELIDALRSYGAPLVLFIDAINEVTFTDIPLRRNEIQLLLEFIADLPLRVVVSCRDVFWTYFIDPRGQDRDFWWQHVYDATYPGRLQAYTDQLMRGAREAAQKAAPGASVELKPKEIQIIREAAVQRVEHRPSLLLGDFTPDELATALGLYQISSVSEDLQLQLRHPLLLHLYSEFALDTIDYLEVVTLGELLARYVEYKLASVRKALPSYDEKGPERLLKRLTSEMRKSHYSKVPVSRLEELVEGDPALKAFKTHLLDEGIVLEYKSDQLVGFQFDALFEYMLSRDIAVSFEGASPANGQIERLGAALIAEAEKFESLVGALEYFCADLERREPDRCRRLLASFAQEEHFGRETFLRILVHLREPLDGRLTDPLFSSLGDLRVDEELAVEAVSRIIEKNDAAAVPLAHAILRRANDIAATRFAQVVNRAKEMPLRDRVALAVELLAAPSRETASAVAEQLEEMLSTSQYSWRRPIAGSRDRDALRPLFDALIQGSLSLSGALLVARRVLPGLVAEAPDGSMAGILKTILTRPEFDGLLHGSSLGDLVSALVEAESEDVLVLSEVAERRPGLLMPLIGLLQVAMIDQPEKGEWVLRALFQRSLRESREPDFALVMLVAIYEIRPEILTRVAAGLAAGEAEEMWRRLKKVGVHRQGGLQAASQIGGGLTFAVLASVIYRFACDHWFFQVTAAGGPPAVSPAFLAACAGQTVFLSLFLPPCLQHLIRFKAATRWTIAAANGLAAVGLGMYHPDWLVAALVLLGTLSGFVFFFKKGITLRAARNAGYTLLAAAGFGLATAAPVAWLMPRLGWGAALVLIAVIWNLFRMLMFGVFTLASATALAAVLRAVLVFWLFAGIEAEHTGPAGRLVAFSITSGMLAAIVFCLHTGRRDGTLRGFAGRWLAIAAAAAVAGAVLLAFFGLWPWALALAVTTALLVLPVSNVSAWLQLRLALALEQLLFAALAGFLTWVTWDTGESLSTLYADAAWWTLVCSSPLLLLSIGVGLFSRRKLRGALQGTGPALAP